MSGSIFFFFRVNTEVSIFSGPTNETRSRKEFFDECVHAYFDKPLDWDITIGDINDYIANECHMPGETLQHRWISPDSYMFKLPSRTWREIFLEENKRVKIKEYFVNFRPWTSSEGATKFDHNVMVKINIQTNKFLSS